MSDVDLINSLLSQDWAWDSLEYSTYDDNYIYKLSPGGAYLDVTDKSDETTRRIENPLLKKLAKHVGDEHQKLVNPT